ncbi:MAG: glutathione S-transferase family protein [Magnetovibrio sp.]|nr:glutathione S-transferase family protein [Magnetovibrio sp.]
MVRILGRANSINVQKVMWCAAEIGLDVERVDIGMKFGGNDTPEYLAKNPNGLIPTLEDGDFVAWESHTIVRYLAEKYGARPWWPAALEDRTRASQWMDWYLTRIHPPMTVIFWNVVRHPPEKRDPEAVVGATVEAAKAWRILDDLLAGQDYVGGAEPSIGDIPVGCYCYRWFEMDFEKPAFANLGAWYERLKARAPYRDHVMLPLS